MRPALLPVVFCALGACASCAARDRPTRAAAAPPSATRPPSPRKSGCIPVSVADGRYRFDQETPIALPPPVSGVRVMGGCMGAIEDDTNLHHRTRKSALGRVLTVHHDTMKRCLEDFSATFEAQGLEGIVGRVVFRSRCGRKSGVVEGRLVRVPPEE